MSQHSSTDSAYLVTARRWRPQRFVEVVGQEHITTTLRNALTSRHIHHAYLFCGPRGVGKTTTARILARAVNCSQLIDNVEPCNECATCTEILSGRSLDVVEIDGASNNSVEDVRRLRENAKYPPSSGKFKVYIIDEVHMLSTSAFNALLKTLEEPPAHLLFIFATTEPHKVPPTIQSRCQRFDFHRMDTRTIVAHLQTIATAEGVRIDEDALFTIARFADGSMRDAQSLFDQARAFASDTITGTAIRESLHVLGEDVYFAITDAIKQRNLAHAFELASRIVQQGYDVHQTLVGLLEHLRNILTVIATGTADLIEASTETQQLYRIAATQWSADDLVQMLTLVAATEQALRYAPQPRLRLELLLAQLVQLPSAQDIGMLIEKLDKIASSGDSTPTLSEQMRAIPQANSPSPAASIPTAHAPITPGQQTVRSPDNPTPSAEESPSENSPDWAMLVERLPKLFAKVKHALLRATPRFQENTCVITCDDITIEFLTHKRPQLEKALSVQLGKPITVTLIKTEHIDTSSLPSASPSTTPPSDDLTPLERALIEELHAKRLPLIG